MKRFVLIAVISSFFFLVSSNAQSVKITGKAKAGPYTSPIGNNLPVQLEVKFKVVNNEKKSIKFDTLRVFWQSGTGYFGQVTTKEKGIFLIEPGKSEEFEYDTDGYTMQLIDKESKQVSFIFAFYMKDKLVLGPYMADLPDIGTLLESFLEESATKEFELIFEKVKFTGK